MARGRVPRRFPRSIAFVAVRLESARGALPTTRYSQYFQKSSSPNDWTKNRYISHEYSARLLGGI